jgi:hypothetical protein
MEIVNVILFSEGLVFTMWVLSGLGIIIAVIILFINVYHRNKT